jgi:Rrf2 family protein
LNQLKQAGFVASKRGNEGGYLLARAPADLSVGEVLRFTEDCLWPVEVRDREYQRASQLRSEASLSRMWLRAEEALTAIYDQTTFKDLLDEDTRLQQADLANYSI